MHIFGGWLRPDKRNHGSISNLYITSPKLIILFFFPTTYLHSSHITNMSQNLPASAMGSDPNPTQQQACEVAGDLAPTKQTNQSPPPRPFAAAYPHLNADAPSFVPNAKRERQSAPRVIGPMPGLHANPVRFDSLPPRPPCTIKPSGKPIDEVLIENLPLNDINVRTLNEDTLIFIFYRMDVDSDRTFASKELSGRGWLFHIPSRYWMKVDGPPTEVGNGYIVCPILRFEHEMLTFEGLKYGWIKSKHRSFRLIDTELARCT